MVVAVCGRLRATSPQPDQSSKLRVVGSSPVSRFRERPGLERFPAGRSPEATTKPGSVGAAHAAALRRYQRASRMPPVGGMNQFAVDRVVIALKPNVSGL